MTRPIQKPKIKPAYLNLTDLSTYLGFSATFIKEIVAMHPDEAPVYPPIGKPHETRYKMPEFEEWFFNHNCSTFAQDMEGGIE